VIRIGERPWTAAAYLVDDREFTGTQHGVKSGGGTLCGLPADAIAVVRNPFWGQRPNDCRACAARIAAPDADAPPDA
jgi:hypothetical protein